MNDPVNYPAHYVEGRAYEPIEVIEAWGLGFHEGNALKYISRAGRKDPSKAVEDLEKAKWYARRLVETRCTLTHAMRGMAREMRYSVMEADAVIPFDDVTEDWNLSSDLSTALLILVSMNLSKHCLWWFMECIDREIARLEGKE